MEACAKKAGNTEYESGEKIVGQEISPCSEIMTCSVGKACNEGLTEEEEVKRQRQLRIKVVKDTTKKIRSKEGWMHATAGGSVNCWRRVVRKLGSIQERKNHAKMVCLVGSTKKEDEKRRMEELRQLRVSQMIKSADGSAALLHKITKPTAWRRGAQILKKEEEDVRLSDRCEANKKEWAKHWQCDEHGGQAKENDEIEEIGGSPAKAKRKGFGESVKIVQRSNRSRL